MWRCESCSLDNPSVIKQCTLCGESQNSFWVDIPHRRPRPSRPPKEVAISTTVQPKNPQPKNVWGSVVPGAIRTPPPVAGRPFVSYSRYSRVLPTSNNRSQQVLPPIVSAAQQIQCSLCTFLNSTTSDTCSMCGLSLHEVEWANCATTTTPPSGRRGCLRCSFEDDESSVACALCGYSLQEKDFAADTSTAIATTSSPDSFDDTCPPTDAAFTVDENKADSSFSRSKIFSANYDDVGDERISPQNLRNVSSETSLLGTCSALDIQTMQTRNGSIYETYDKNDEDYRSECLKSRRSSVRDEWKENRASIVCSSGALSSLVTAGIQSVSNAEIESDNAAGMVTAGIQSVSNAEIESDNAAGMKSRAASRLDELEMKLAEALRVAKGPTDRSISSAIMSNTLDVDDEENEREKEEVVCGESLVTPKLMSSCRFVILMGITCSGKTSLARKFEAQGFSITNDKRGANSLLSNGSKVVIDRDNLRLSERTFWRNLAMEHIRDSEEIITVFLDIDSKICKRRAKKRPGGSGFEFSEKVELPNASVEGAVLRLRNPANLSVLHSVLRSISESAGG